MVTMTTLSRGEEPDGAPRIAGLDVLRGLAILGILFMNIPGMAASPWQLFVGDPRLLGWTLADRVAWFAMEVFANGTARCLLEMLFGVGMLILTDRAAQAAAGRWSVLRAYWWRNLVLFLFGLVHLFVLLWMGDILHTYGIAAMVAVLFRTMKPRWLLAIGLSMALLQLGGGGYGYLQRSRSIAAERSLAAAEQAGRGLTTAEARQKVDLDEKRAERAKSRAENIARAAADDRARTGDFTTWARTTWDAILWYAAQGYELFGIWEAAATMLIGAALYRWGIIQGARSRGFYVRLAVAGYAFGLGFRTLGALATVAPGRPPSILWPMGEVARLATTLGHVGLVYVLLATVAGARLLRPFEAAGRTALTLYVMQTIICLWALYPPFALALYGTQGWATMMLTAAAVNAGLLLLANWYVRRFSVAPVEWAWRSLVERRLLPFGRCRVKPPLADALPA